MQKRRTELKTKNIWMCMLLFINITIAQNKPNIVFFMVDDLGWMDSEIYGSEYYETPNITRLAKMGMRFTRAYTANPLCSPTRASILSGKHPGRFRLTTAAGHLPANPNADLSPKKGQSWMKVASPKSRTFMPLEEFTLAEALKTNGYKTAHIGKWHLGSKGYWPENQGFDINIGGGHNPGPPNFFSPYNVDNLKNGADKEYLTDRMANEATAFLEAHKDTTFFLNYWLFAVHAPYQAPQSLIDKYAAKQDPRDKQKNPIMGAMIEKMDESLGEVLDKLEELKLMDNTMIVFFSDNGGNMYDVVNGEFPTNNSPLSYGKGNIHEGGIRVPMIVVWDKKVAANTVSDALVQSIDFYPTFLELTGTTPNSNQVLDGVSLANLWLKNEPLSRDAIYSHFPHYTSVTGNVPSTAVWYKHYKMIKEYGQAENRSAAYKLYDLKKDIGETTDISAKHPKLSKKMAEMIENHLKDIDAMVPVKNPAYDPKAKSKLGITHDFPIHKYLSY